MFTYFLYYDCPVLKNHVCPWDWVLRQSNLFEFKILCWMVEQIVALQLSRTDNATWPLLSTQFYIFLRYVFNIWIFILYVWNTNDLLTQIVWHNFVCGDNETQNLIFNPSKNHLLVLIYNREPYWKLSASYVTKFYVCIMCSISNRRIFYIHI